MADDKKPAPTQDRWGDIAAPIRLAYMGRDNIMLTFEVRWGFFVGCAALLLIREIFGWFAGAR